MQYVTTVNQPRRTDPSPMKSLPGPCDVLQFETGAVGVLNSQRPDFSKASRYRSMLRDCLQVLSDIPFITSTIARSEGIPQRGEKVESPLDESIRLSVAVDRWLAFHAGHWCEKSTKNARSIMARLLQSTGRGLLATRLEDGHIQDFWLTLKPGPGWAQYVGSYLASLCRWLQRRGVLRSDPSMAWPRIAYDRRGAFRTVSHEEEAQLLQVLSRAMRRYMVLAIGTGLRRGTIYSCIWGWVDSDWVLNIPASALKNRRALSLPLSAKVRAALGRRGSPDSPLISGLPHPDYANELLRNAAVLAGIDPKHLTTHQFRKTWVERCHEAGATREEVQLMQNWRTASVLLDAYWPRVATSRAREIFERI